MAQVLPTDSANERQHRTVIATAVNDLIKVRPPGDQTAAEAKAGVTPRNTSIPSHIETGGDVLLARYGGKCDNSTDDTRAWVDAIAVAKVVGIEGASTGRDQGVDVVFSGKSVVSSPVVLPRGGNSRAYSVGIRGASKESSGIYPTTAITSDDGIVQWEATTARLFGCRLRQFHIFLANAAQRAVSFELNDPGTTVSGGQQWGQEEIKELDIDLLIYGSNTYHQQLVHIEGKAKYGTIKIHADIAQGSTPTYTPIALWCDSDCIKTDGTDGAKADAIVDNAGVEYAIVDINCVNSRGGFAAPIRGRLHNCVVQRLHTSTGSYDSTSCIYLRDSTTNVFHVIETEGRQETYQVYLENCYYNQFLTCNIGTPDAPGPATAFRLVNSSDNEFHSKASATGKPSYSSQSGLLLDIDATSSRNKFFKFASTAAFAVEVSDLGSDNFIEYYREDTGLITETHRRTSYTVGPWLYDNVAASLTDVEFPTGTRWVAPRAGLLKAVTVKSNEARTASTLTVKVFKSTNALFGQTGSEVSSSFRVQLNATDTSSKVTLAANDYTFNAGDEIYPVVLTGGTWTPITADIRVYIEVMC